MTQPYLPEQREPLLQGEEQYISYDDDEALDNIKRRQRIKDRKRICLFVVIAVILIIAVAIGLFILYHYIKEKEHHEFPPSLSILGKYKHAAVASDILECSNIGKDILQQKGSAVDAAIATLICYGVFQPQSSGLGGGFFMTVYDSNTRKAEIFDAREEAPGRATKDMYVKDPKAAIDGPLAIGIPGEVKGYIQAYKKYGKLPWRHLFNKSIEYAEKGFRVQKHLADMFENQKGKIMNNTEMRNTYTNKKTNQLYKEGELLKLPKLAATLKTLASNDGEDFYKGQLAKDIIAELTEQKSIITAADLANYTAPGKQPLTVTLTDGSTLYSPPPPSSGAVLSFILSILDGYHMKPEMLKTRREKLLAYHRIIEAFKFAYAKRTNLGDPNFNPPNMTELVKNLTSRAYADMIRGKIWDNTTHGLDYYGPTFYDRLTKSTAHLSIIGNDGLAVSVTSTVNTRFGSGILGSKTGILYNNEMDDFSTPNVTNSFGIPPSPANFIAPGKRPLSSMCPAVLVDKDNKIKLVVGAAGGSRITTATAWVAARALWFGENIKQAIDSRRLHHQLLPQYIEYEPKFPQFYLDGFEKLHHNISSTGLGNSITNGITTDKDYIYANCDFRRDGSHPAGF